MSKFLALFALAAGPAFGQTVHAPALGRSALPGFGILSAVPSGVLGAPAARPTLAPALSPTLALPHPSPLPQAGEGMVKAAVLPLPLAGEGGVRAAAVLQSVSVPLAKAAGAPAAQAPILSNLFEGRRIAPAGAVFAEPAASRPSVLAAANLAAEKEDSAPPAPARPAWKTAGLYALRTAGFLGALYGGFRVGDMVYLGAGFLGNWGLLVSLPVLGAAAWWLGRRPDASPLGRSVMGGLFGSMGLVVVGQQVWDLVHTPWGLFVGVPVGVALALVASGLLPRRRKFTAEPPNLDPRRPQG